MPRRLLKKWLPDRHALAQSWFMRPFGALLKDPVYWTPHRRGVVRAFAVGLFICFIPLPIHLILAPLAALVLRVNLPVTVLTTCIVNPFTVLPTFFTAYWVGARLMGEPLLPFRFALTWEWISGPMLAIWKPLLLGCLVLSVTAALAGYLLLSLVWRLGVRYRYQSRPWKLRRKNGGFDQDSVL